MIVRIVGSFVSPYVRKVLAVIALKGLDYEIDPITPSSAATRSSGSRRFVGFRC